MPRNTLPTVLLAALLALGAGPAFGQGKTDSDPAKAPPPSRKALNRVFKGRIIKIKKNKVTIYYDFEDPAQLEDFEDARPPRLLDASENRVSIQGGRLVVEGSSAIRHKMEGVGELRANFYIRVGQQSNVGTYFTEPVMSDFFVVLNLFDDRFYRDGALILAACGKHEDEGAEDLSTGLVNWRDIFKSNVKKHVKVGKDAEIEVWKDGWKEGCRVNDKEGKGSSKGKTTEMKSYKFGVWVHHSRATFDDMTITFQLDDEFLDLYDLKAEVDVDWEEIPESGPFAGMRGVPPRLRTEVEDYAARKAPGKPLVRAIRNSGLNKKIRKIVAQVLKERKESRLVPALVDALYSEEKLARQLGIDVIKAIVGKNFGYSAGSSEKNRSKAIQKLNAFLSKNRKRFYG